MDASYLEASIDEAYVFCGRRYARIKVVPGTTIDKITFGPAKIAEHWPSLVEAGFGKVDAVIPVPGFKQEIWVFSGTQFVRIKVVPSSKNDTIVFGPAEIADHWPSLVKADFSTVDAVFPTPGEPNHAYFFNQDQFARITLTPGKAESSIVFGPAKIHKHWPALAKAGFTVVDSVIPAPGYPNDGYFFRGDQYIRLRVAPGTVQDEVIFGPANVEKHWPALAWF